jgi:archaellum biogenesis ATPase FlaH
MTPAEKFSERYGIDLSREGKVACPRCRKRGNDSSGNNLHSYGFGKGAHCFACGLSVPSDDYAEEQGWTLDEEEDDEVSTREKITPEENEKIKSYTSTRGQGYRGIRDETNTFFGVRYEIDEETGKPCKQFVPTTISGELAGYRVRKFPKDFSGPIGQVGKECDFIGQFRFQAHVGTVLIVGGEVDFLSAYQILRDNQLSRGKENYDSIAVISSTLGEAGTAKQAKQHYEWLARQKKIVVMLDSDEAGQAATDELAKVLPRGKVFIGKMRLKDANSYIWDNVNQRSVNREQEFVNDFWNAQPYSPAGIVSADSIYSEIVERAKVQKLPFPPMLNKLNRMLAGGVNYGYIVNCLAGSGCGKSSLVNQCVAYWMTELKQKVGVVSLEAEAGEFGENLLSYYMGRKIAMINDPEEKLQFVESEEAARAARELFMSEDGVPRLYLLDDRGDYSKLQEKIEELIVSCDVKIIVIDVISDVFAGMSIEQIDLWMAWEKKLVKQYNCILIQVAHTRKGNSNEKAASQGKALTEESIIGSGTQYRSAGINIALQRDKTHEDPMTRNTTTVHLLKSRATGMTGVACELFYDSDTHQLFDKEEYFMTHGPKDF